MLDVEVKALITAELGKFNTIVSIIRRMDGKLPIRPRLPTPGRKRQRMINRLSMAYQGIQDQVSWEQFHRVVAAQCPDVAGEVMEECVWMQACDTNEE